MNNRRPAPPLPPKLSSPFQRVNWRKKEAEKNKHKHEVANVCKKADKGLVEIYENFRRLQEMSRNQTFAGLIYVTPYFEKGIYKYVKGTRKFLDFYKNNIKDAQLIDEFFYKILKLKREELFKHVSEVRAMLLKLGQWFPVFLNQNNNPDIKWQVVRGIEKFEELDFMLIEL